MIKVAIADDSPFTCNLLASYLEAGGECRGVGMAHNAGATLDLIRTAAPDVLPSVLEMSVASPLVEPGRPVRYRAALITIWSIATPSSRC